MPGSRAVHVGLDDPARRVPALAGTSPEVVAAALLDLVLGVEHPRRPAFETFLGLDPANPLPATASDVHGATAAQIYWVSELMRGVGVRVAVQPQAWPALSTVSGDPTTDFRRRRIARMLGLPPLAARGRPPHWWSTQVSQGVRMGLRVLAAAGPLYFDEVASAVARTRRWRTGEVTEDTLMAGLAWMGATVLPFDGRWQHRAVPSMRDANLIAAANSTDRSRHTSRQMHRLLIQAGYAPASAVSYIARHPLIQRTGRDRYRVLGTPEPG